jgi:predicted RNA-binding protein
MQINSNLDLIETKIKDKKILDKLDSIRQSTEYLNNLVSNLNFILQKQNNNFIKENINI